MLEPCLICVKALDKVPMILIPITVTSHSRDFISSVIAINANQIQLRIAQRRAFPLDLEWSMGIEYLAGVAESLEFATIAGADLSFYSGRAHVRGTLDFSR